jgi:hypothetical protein
MQLRCRQPSLLAAFVLVAVSWPATAAAPHKLMPDDAQMVIRINVKGLLESDIVKKNALEQIKTALRENIQLGLIFDSLGFDPMRDVNSLVLAVSQLPEAPPQPGAGLDQISAGEALVIVEGKFDLKKVHETLALAAKDNPDQLSVSEYNGLKLYEGKQNDQTMFVVFLDGSTVLLSNKKPLITTAVDVHQGKRKPNPNRTMVNMLAKVSEDDTVIMALPLPQAAKEAARNNPQAAVLVESLEGFTASATTGKDLNVSLFIHTTDAQGAQQIRAQLEALKQFAAGALQGQGVPGGEALAEMIQNAKIEVTAGKTVSVKMTLTQEMIDKAGR